MDSSAMNRWRLVLGQYADDQIPVQDDPRIVEIDDALEFLYGREYSEEMGVRGGNERMLTVPKWIAKIRELFPKEVVEVLENHALERYDMKELLRDKEVLEKLQPNKALLKSVLQMKDYMDGEVLQVARKIVKQVIEEIRKELEQDVKQALIGKLDRSSEGYLKNKNNIDIKKTIMRNLKNYNMEMNKLIVEKVVYNSRVKNYSKWNVIIAVDESGSMMDSVIHSAVMASIFAGLPMIRTKLVIFDTEVVDLSDYIDDPLRTMMSIRLGGGTHIYKALNYCRSLITEPHKTIFVLVSDLYENGSLHQMYREAGEIIDMGAKFVALTALNDECVGVYSKEAASVLSEMGAEVAALTPGGLAKWISEKIN